MKKISYWLVGVMMFLGMYSSSVLAADEGVRLEKALKLPGAMATSMAISNDGMQALIGMDKDGAVLVDLKNLKAPYVLKKIETEVPVDSVAYNGRIAFLALRGGKIATVDLKQGKIMLIRDFPEFGDAKMQLKISPRGGQLLIVNGKKAGIVDLRMKVSFEKALVKMIDFTIGNDVANPVQGVFSPDEKRIAISLQKNNMIGLVDSQSGKIEKTFSLGETKHRADLKDDDFPLVEDMFTARLEPADLAFSSDGKFIYTTNQGSPELPVKTGEIWSGGRNFSIFKIDGTLAYDGLDKLEQTTLMLGAYSDKNSPIRGIEPNMVTNGQLYDKPAIAIGAAHVDGVFFFQTAFPDKPFFYGMALSSGKKVEAVSGVGKRDGFISIDQNGMLSIYLPIDNRRETGTGH